MLISVLKGRHVLWGLSRRRVPGDVSHGVRQHIDLVQVRVLLALMPIVQHGRNVHDWDSLQGQ